MARARCTRARAAGRRKAKRTQEPLERPIFKKKQQHLRWSALAQLTDPLQLFERIRDEVFPFLEQFDGADSESSYARHMRDAVFMSPSATQNDET